MHSEFIRSRSSVVMLKAGKAPSTVLKTDVTRLFCQEATHSSPARTHDMRSLSRASMDLSKSPRSIRKRRPITQARNSFDPEGGVPAPVACFFLARIVSKKCSKLSSPANRFGGNIFSMAKDNLSTKQILAIRCPTCGAAPGEKCELSTGLPRTGPHRDRRLSAAD